MKGKRLLIVGLLLTIGIILFWNFASLNDEDKVGHHLDEINLKSDEERISIEKKEIQFASAAVENISVNEEESQSKKDEKYILECAEQPNLIEPVDELDYESMIESYSKLNEENGELLSILSSKADKGEKIEKLSKHFRQYENKVSAWNLLKECSSADVEQCNESLMTSVVEIENNNSAGWFALASFYAVKHEDELMLQALEHAVSSPIFEDNFSGELRIYYDLLENTGNLTEIQLSLELMGIWAATSIPSYQFMSRCKEIMVNNAAAAQTCFDAGNALANRGAALVSQAVGANLKKVVAEYWQSESLVESIEKEIKELKSHWNSDEYNKTHNLAMNDFSLYSHWIQSILSHGEKAAHMMLIEEAVRRSATPGYNPCTNGLIKARQ